MPRPARGGQFLDVEGWAKASRDAGRGFDIGSQIRYFSPNEGLVPKRISRVHDVGLGQPIVCVRVAEARGGSGIHRLLQRPS